MRKTSCLRTALLLLVSVLVLTCALALPAAADTQKYSVEQADFVVTLLKNGDALVTETWTLRYDSGSFTRFYKDIHLEDLKEYERFTQIEYETCTIDGAPAVYVNDSTRREANTWTVVNTSENATINWYLPVTGPRSVTYSCSYVIRGAVRMMDDGRAVFGYRLVGANFKDTIGLTTVTVHLPEGCTDIRNHSKLSTPEINANTAQYRVTSHSGLQKYILTAEGSAFSGLRSVHIKEDEFAGSSEIVGSIIGGFFSAALFGGAVYAIARSSKKQKAERAQKLAAQKARREHLLNQLEANPSHMTDVLQRFADAGITPLELGCTLTMPSYGGTVFLVAMLCQMVNEGQAEIDDNEICISSQAAGPKFQQDFVLAMCSMFDYEERDGILCFNTQKLLSVLVSLDKNCEFFGTLDQILQGMVRTIPEELKEDYQDVEEYLSYTKFDSDLNNLLQLAKEYSHVDPLLLAGAFTGPCANTESQDPLSALALQCIALRHNRMPVRTSSSGSDSGCGGCSGCSGCSGCGGGGAD